MDLPTFETLLDRHGGDLFRWPASERAAAMALLETSAAAQAARAEMLDVEALLRAGFVRAADAVDATTAHATRHRQETRAVVRAMRAGWAVAAVLVLALGLSIGGMLPLSEVSPEPVVAAAFDAGGAADVD